MRMVRFNLPDDVYTALTKHAEANRRSLPKQLIWILEDYAINTPLPERTVPERQAS